MPSRPWLTPEPWLHRELAELNKERNLQSAREADSRKLRSSSPFGSVSRKLPRSLHRILLISELSRGSNPYWNRPARCRSAWRCEETQNTLYTTLSKSHSEWRLEAEKGDLDWQDWLRMLTAVSEKLGMKLS
jgi:hypothetical protein